MGNGKVEEWRLGQPRQKVTATEPTGDPRGAPAGQEHVSSRLVELVGDLAPGLSAADDQNLSGRKCLSVAVAFGVDRVQAAPQGRGGRRTMCLLVRASCDDDRFWTQLAFRRVDDESVGDRTQRGHGYALADGRLERARV